MKYSIKLKFLVFITVALFSIQRSAAQKEALVKTQKSEVQSMKLPFTKEMEDQVVSVVQPVRDKIEELLKEDRSGNYTAYADDVRKLEQLKKPEERKSAIQRIQKKYYPFIKKIWDQAKIDEKDYQQKLKNIFPPEMRETINFTEFLNFSVSGKSQKPAPPPIPPNVCIDAATGFFGLQEVTQSAIGKATVHVVSNRILTDCVSEIAGNTKAQGWILSDIKIPGTFPSDSKRLRITKSYVWNAYATAVTILGASFATIATSTDNFSNDVFVRAWAPVIFVSPVSRNEVRTVQTVLSKQFLLNIRFGVMNYCDTYAGAFALSFSGSYCENLMWSVCEE